MDETKEQKDDNVVGNIEIFLQQITFIILSKPVKRMHDFVVEFNKFDTKKEET